MTSRWATASAAAVWRKWDSACLYCSSAQDNCPSTSRSCCRARARLRRRAFKRCWINARDISGERAAGRKVAREEAEMRGMFAGARRRARGAAAAACPLPEVRSPASARERKRARPDFRNPPLRLCSDVMLRRVLRGAETHRSPQYGPGYSLLWRKLLPGDKNPEKGKQTDPSNTRRKASASAKSACTGKGRSRDGEETDRTQAPGPVESATTCEADGSRPLRPVRAERERDGCEAQGRRCACQARSQAGAEACRTAANPARAGDAGDHAPSTAQPDVSIHGTYAAGIPLGEPRVDRAR